MHKQRNCFHAFEKALCICSVMSLTYPCSKTLWVHLCLHSLQTCEQSLMGSSQRKNHEPQIPPVWKDYKDFQKPLIYQTNFIYCTKSKKGKYLVIPALGIRGVWRLIPNEHVIEIEPCKGGDWASVIRQMGDEAVHGGFGDVENQKLFGSFLIFGV